MAKNSKRTKDQQKKEAKKQRINNPGQTSKYALKKHNTRYRMTLPFPWGLGKGPAWKCAYCGNTELWTQWDCLKNCHA